MSLQVALHARAYGVALIGLLAGAGAVHYGPQFIKSNTSTEFIGSNVSTGDCNIKGNISVNSGERIYHVPGQKFYAETIVTPQKGERWFCWKRRCAAGWRKARR